MEFLFLVLLVIIGAIFSGGEDCDDMFDPNCSSYWTIGPGSDDWD